MVKTNCTTSHQATAQEREEKACTIRHRQRTASGSEETTVEAGATTANLPVIQENAATLNDLIDISCRKFRELPAIGMALEEPLTYKGLHERILALAAGMRELGVGAGDRVAILGENSHHWVIAYMATVRLGASTVPIFPELPEADVHHILGEMRCDLIFLTQKQIEKIYDLKHQLKHVVTLDDYRDDTGLINLRTFSEVMAEALERVRRGGAGRAAGVPGRRARTIWPRSFIPRAPPAFPRR